MKSPNFSKNILFALVVSLFCYPAMLNAQQQTLAFPGADGFGKYTTGGRGGKVVYVDNLKDHGPGSFRNAIEMDGARTIVFSVSGHIDLKSPLIIQNGDLTIAGQSAPGDGITVRYYPVEINADNVIIRYMRFRMGDVYKVEDDALDSKGNDNIIIDHCTTSWGTDETATFYWMKNFTMQWSIISESLNLSVHHKGEHGYAAIWGGVKASFHHNLLAHHKSRLPRFSGSPSTANSKDEVTDFRNNVIYNWEINSSYGGEDGRFNVVNNYYKPGPATDKSESDRILNPYRPYGQFYVSGNVMDGAPEVTRNNWNGGVQCRDEACPDSVRRNNPYIFEIDSTVSAEQAYGQVLDEAGASLHRDAIDKRVVKEVRNGSYTYRGSKTGEPGIIDSQEDVGGWIELESEPAPKDSDRDGMPDQWETGHNLNPNDSGDAAGYDLSDRYTNVEVYLNSLIDFPG